MQDNNRFCSLQCKLDSLDEGYPPGTPLHAAAQKSHSAQSMLGPSTPPGSSEYLRHSGYLHALG